MNHNNKDFEPINKDEVEHHLVLIKKALDSKSPEDRKNALIEGFMRFGLRFGHSLGYLADHAEYQGREDSRIYRDLFTEFTDLFTSWLAGERLTDRADEDERRAMVGEMIIKQGEEFVCLGRLAALAILALPKDKKLRDIDLAHQALLKYLNRAIMEKDIGEQVLAIQSLLKYELESTEKSLELIQQGQRLLAQISDPHIRRNFQFEATGYYLKLALEERPGEVIPQIKFMQAQKLTYIIDANVCANQGLVLVCKVDTIDHAQQILAEYLRTTGLDESCIYNFLYGQPSGIMQQLLLTLYDYWPTIESQVTSIRIGGKTISAKYSGRGRYDVRVEDIDEEIRSRISAGEQIESITLKPPVSIGGVGIKIKKVVPKITINDIGVIACRANTNYENFTLIKGFINETVNIISYLVKGKQPRSYSKLEDFTNISDTTIQDSFLPTGMRLGSNDR